ncbi:hypothetical protein DVG78_08450 [Runella aurantiaca]|uniref:Peptidase S74 domain-containing protein n=1 Tax=Runella aurantiaca TaxID=2282308 RepID=A0A369IDE7_9BACT|nr:hypothetical protein DVG78_08450 [Runella aurantiaca]
MALSCGAALAQKADNVGIGTTKPDPSAILDLNSNTKGLLLPRMNQAQRDAIKNPAAGLVIFQTDQVVGTYTFDGTTWQPSNARTSAVSSVGAWDKQGNVIDDTDFIGSTNDKALRFKVNNQFAGKIDLINNLYMGLFSGIASTTGASNVGLGYGALSSNTTGAYNIGIGHYAVASNVSGGNNIGIGTSALFKTTGIWNVGIGSNALASNTTGNYNFGLGGNALSSSVSGGDNVAVGIGALQYLISGSNNMALGTYAGVNATGSSNVFIGYSSGANETGNSKLYIANTATSNPLIKGDFASSWLRVNSKTTGYMVIGDFDTAPSATPGTGGVPLPANVGQVNGYRLVVQDGILCEKLKVALRSTGGDWADYVFEPSYKLMPLEEVEKFTKENRHLPNVPSADEIVKDGLDVSKTSKMFMEKIEELTLHVIELNKRIKELEAKK